MWSPQHYLDRGREKGRTDSVLKEGLRQIRRAKEGRPPLPAVLTLCHLAKRLDLSYGTLRHYVARQAIDPYRQFRIRKHSGGYRRICVPDENLKQVQSWIANHVLRNVPAHPCSQAFSPGDSIVKCASRHAGARWLVKLDVADFFGSITEIQVSRVFRSLGYNKLVSFELARLCTYLPWDSAKHRMPAWKVRSRNTAIEVYRQNHLGRLPQGASTSPMLANLAMRQVDEALRLIAEERGLIYSRYSDDMTFSTDAEFSREDAKRLIQAVADELKARGLFLNRSKTKVVHPGARRIVLGLLVDGPQPVLSRAFRDNLRQHFHYLKKFGVDEHVRARNFDSAGGLYRHLRGLVDFASMVDARYGASVRGELDSVRWPGVV